MATNRKLGNTFEAEFCEALYAEGFWVHNMAQNQAGQPADVPEWKATSKLRWCCGSRAVTVTACLPCD